MTKHVLPLSPCLCSCHDPGVTQTVYFSNNCSLAMDLSYNGSCKIMLHEMLPLLFLLLTSQDIKNIHTLSP